MSYRNDLEAGGYRTDDDDEASRRFHVVRSKNARRRWRLAACVVYASRAFCYILIRKKHRRERSIAAIRSHAQIVGGAHPFQDSMRGVNVPGTTDLPAKPVHAGEFGISSEDDDEASEPFNVVRTKNAPVEVLHRWRQAAWVLNAPRRFRYTRDLENDERRKRLTAKIKSHTQIIRAACFFQDSMRGVNAPGTTPLPSKPVHAGEFGISSEELVSMSRELDCCLLQQNGGVKGVADKLNSCLEKGLPEDDTDLINRRNKFGSNAYLPKKGPSLWRFLREAFQDLTLIILMVAAAAIIGLSIKAEGVKEGWYAGGSIVLAVLIVVIFKALSDYRQFLQFYNLGEEKRHVRTKVIRGGRRVEISIFEIVVGDVVCLEIGDQVPADGLLVSGYSLSIDESCMTGESVLVNKNSRAPFLMSGCEVADGYGTMLVTNVGLNTEWGLLMSSISQDNFEETPLQIRLSRVATYTGKVGLAVAATVLLVLIIRFFNGYTKDPNGTIQFRAGTTTVSDAIDGFIKLFTVAVTIVIVAVPEGLPLAVTLMLAYSMRKMMADKALFRRLSACETMGSATTICVDKTGTITLNQMTVVEAYVCGKKIEPPYKNPELPPAVVSLLIEGIANNTTGSVFVPEVDGALEISGSPTEKAVLQWGVNLGMDFGAARSNSMIICAFPFNSKKKRAGVAVKLPNSEIHVHWKGAAETILASCTSYVDADDTVVQMDEDKLLHFGNAIEDMSARSLRCVAIAYRPYEMDNIPTITKELESWQLPEDDLVLLAVVGIKDPCRPGVRDAVTLCVNAGVKVRMVTGDNLQTARAIALECGILGPNADATDFSLIEGRTFRCLSETKRLQVADKISVMAKSLPNDKLLLVQALRKRGHVVAVTGAGVDDAPALHEADVGLAMGIQGTEVAKKSADVIVMDDNFASVVKVVRWGRSVYANIQKFIQFQLTVTVTALMLNFVAAVASGYVPLNVVQLLWISLIMDSLGALALAKEPPTDHLMHRPPVGRREPLITNIMWRNIIVQALYQVTVLLVLNFQGRRILNLEHDSSDHAFKVKNTLVFNAFVFCQIFNLFNARKPDEFNIWRGVTRNHLFFGIVGFTVTLQFLIIHFLGKFTSTVRLTWKLWLFSIAIGFISWPLAAVGKLILVPAKPFSTFFTKKTDRQRNFGDTSVPQRNAGSALESGRTFDWESGAEISLEAAKAIAHMHSPSIGKLTDEDVKASSIFLTEDINAYISDFGFYRLGFPVISSRNAVYLEPEVVGNKFAEKSGIYSFCVLFLGILSKAQVFARGDSEADLPISIQSNEEEAPIAEVLDGDLVNDANASACDGEGVEDDTCNV